MIISMAERIQVSQPRHDQIALFWLGQAGFVLKAPDGTVLFLDAYLSHSVERKFGPQWKRIMPSPMPAGDVDCDWFVSTHEHDDHLDVDSIPEISRNKRAKFAGPYECQVYYRSVGIREDRSVELVPETRVQMGGFTCTPVFADHGDQAPDAVGLLIEYNNLCIYHTGDTALRPEQMTTAIGRQPQVILPCINGAFGNMNADEAARLAALTGAKIIIPTHFWTFVEHRSDPYQFAEYCRSYAPNAEVRWMTQGEGTLIPCAL